jgi:lysophospholipase L1-like esterase
VNSRLLQELRAAWLALGLLLGLMVPPPGPVLLGLTLLPWLMGGAVLLRRGSGEGIPASIALLSQDTAGRMTLLVAAVLGVLLAFLTNLFLALLVMTWAAALSLILAVVIGPNCLRATWQRAVTLGAAIAVVCAGLEAVLRLPFFEEQFGSPAATRAWKRRYDRVAEENAFGFRTVHQTMSRTPGVPRILALGDSYTWGEKIPSTDSIWPSLLEAELRRLSPGRPTEVVNISRAGWSTADEARALERIGWQFQPDRLLIQFYLNDHDPPVGDPKFMRRLGKPPAVLKGGALQSSALANLLRVKYWETLGQSALHANLIENYEDGSPGWRRVSGGLRQIAASARAHGVPATLVLFTAFPPGHWTPGSYPYRQLHRKVARRAEAEGMEVLDLTSAYAAEGGDWSQWWVTPYDRHPNSAAHLVAARAIAAYLAERGWATDSSARHSSLRPQQ